VSGTWQEAAERLRQQINNSRLVVVGSQRTQVETRPLFAVGQSVTFSEGRTRRPRRGYVEAVHPIPGWPPEYDVQIVHRDGTTGRVTRKFQSELEADRA